jgi:hemolysin activation/secretion protein
MKGNRIARHHCLTALRWALLLALCALASSVAAQVLPPPPSPSPGRLALTQPRLFVHGFTFEGNHVYSDAELARVTEPFKNRELTSEDLEQVRRAVTLHYVNHGYVNSGAVIPDQNAPNGVILIRIVEGVLTRIDLHGNRWLRKSYLEPRVRRWAPPPLNLNQLQDGLQLLRQNPNVRQINAELKPRTTPGEANLDLRVVDQQPFRLGLQIDNQRPPSVGSEEISLLAADLNLTGHSDPLDIRYGIANSTTDGLEFSGADNMEGSYLLPFTRFDTSLGLHASRLNTSLVEESFTNLNLTSLTTSYGVVLRQPVYQSANREAALSLGFDRRVNETLFLNGQPFPVPGATANGDMVVSVLRLSQEWLERGQDHVLALRSTFNLGLNVFDATDNGFPGDPTAKFFSWLGQAQYIQRLFHTQNELVFRLSGQYTDDRLLALEQMAVGGMETVRGYLENQLVRDKAIVASIEFRLPVLFNKAGAGIVSVAPFFDFGGGWNVSQSPEPTTIYSTGLGLLLAPCRNFNAQLYWGYRLRHVEEPEPNDPQDLGLHFRINVQAF